MINKAALQGALLPPQQTIGGAHVKAPGRKGSFYDISDFENQRLDVDVETKKLNTH